MHHFNYYVTEAQLRLLREVSSAAGISVAEVVRRMTDHCLKTEALDGIIPCCSGVLSASGKVN